MNNLFSYPLNQKDRVKQDMEGTHAYTITPDTKPNLTIERLDFSDVEKMLNKAGIFDAKKIKSKFDKYLAGMDKIKNTDFNDNPAMLA